MSKKLKEHDLKYILGHTFKTDLVGQTYQPPDRNVDTTSLRYSAHMEANMDIIEHHSSVAFGRTVPLVAPNSVSEDEFNHDPEMIRLVQQLVDLQARVTEAERFRGQTYDEIILTASFNQYLSFYIANSGQ